MLSRKFKSKPVINVAKIKRIPKPVATDKELDNIADEIGSVEYTPVSKASDLTCSTTLTNSDEEKTEETEKEKDIPTNNENEKENINEFKVPSTAPQCSYDDVFNSDIEENVIQIDLQKKPTALQAFHSKSPRKSTPNQNSPHRLSFSSDDNCANKESESTVVCAKVISPFSSPTKRRRTISNSSTGDYPLFRKRERTISNSSTVSLSHHYSQPSCIGRVRTESTSSNTSDCSSPTSKSRTVEDHRIFAKKDFEIRFKNGAPEKTRFKMFDLIYFNPKTQPMTRKLNGTILKAETTELDLAKIEKTEVETDEVPLLAPKLKLNANGELVLDNQSLLVETTDDIKAREALKNSSVILLDETVGMNGFYKRTKRTKSWSAEETLRFYKCLQIVGSDFSLIEHLFPKRSRRDIKLKYKKEERNNPGLIDMAILHHKEFNIEDLKASLEEEERDKEEAAKQLKLFKEAKKSVPYKKKSKSKMTRTLHGKDEAYDIEHLPRPRFKNPKKKRKTVQNEPEQTQAIDDVPAETEALPPFSSIKKETRVKAELCSVKKQPNDSEAVLEEEINELLQPTAAEPNSKETQSNNINSEEKIGPESDCTSCANNEFIDYIVYESEDIDINELMPNASELESNTLANEERSCNVSNENDWLTIRESNAEKIASCTNEFDQQQRGGDHNYIARRPSTPRDYALDKPGDPSSHVACCNQTNDIEEQRSQDSFQEVLSFSNENDENSEQIQPAISQEIENSFQTNEIILNVSRPCPKIATETIDIESQKESQTELEIAQTELEIAQKHKRYYSKLFYRKLSASIESPVPLHSSEALTLPSTYSTEKSSKDDEDINHESPKFEMGAAALCSAKEFDSSNQLHNEGVDEVGNTSGLTIVLEEDIIDTIDLNSPGISEEFNNNDKSDYEDERLEDCITNDEQSNRSKDLVEKSKENDADNEREQGEFGITWSNKDSNNDCKSACEIKINKTTGTTKPELTKNCFQSEETNDCITLNITSASDKESCYSSCLKETNKSTLLQTEKENLNDSANEISEDCITAEETQDRVCNQNEDESISTKQATDDALAEEDIYELLQEIEQGALVLVITPDPDGSDCPKHEIYMRDLATGKRHATPLDVPEEIVQMIASLIE